MALKNTLLATECLSSSFVGSPVITGCGKSHSVHNVCTRFRLHFLKETDGYLRDGLFVQVESWTGTEGMTVSSHVFLITRPRFHLTQNSAEVSAKVLQSIWDTVHIVRVAGNDQRFLIGFYRFHGVKVVLDIL